MTQTRLDIYNKAISAVGGKARLASLADEVKARFECDIWYETAAKVAQEAAWWPSSRQVARLALLSSQDESRDWMPGDPDPAFRHSFALPVDILRPWHLADFSRFTLGFDATWNRQVLYTNCQAPILIFSSFQPDPVWWTSGLYMATAYGLAGYIANGLMGNPQVGQVAIQMADRLLIDAQTHAANMPESRVESLPEELLVRGYDSPRVPTQYTYPLGTNYTGLMAR